MPNGTYGGVRGKETKVGQKTFVSQPTRLFQSPRPLRTGIPLSEIPQASPWRKSARA